MSSKDFSDLIDLALEYGGVVVVVISVLAGLLGRGKRQARRQREVGLGKPRSGTEPIEPGADTGKLSQRMGSW